jgi:hypothetical protein
MSLEFNTDLIPDRHRKRREESEKIRGLIPVLGAVAATRAILQKCHGSALVQQKRVVETLEKSSRDELIEKIFETEEICLELAEKLNPKCLVDNYAFYMRRIHILSLILSNNIADGEVASITTDLVLGKRRLDISNLEIVQEYNQKMAPIKEQYL